MEHAVVTLRKQIAYAERRIAEINHPYMGPAGASTREHLTQHWNNIKADCQEALNVLYAERGHRELKRRGIL